MKTRTAVIVYQLPDHIGYLAWGVGASQADTDMTMRDHLLQHAPLARFVGVVWDEPRAET